MSKQDHQLEFPGGPYGFELVSRFCYNNGRMKITVSNVSLLHCCSIYLGMHNLLKQTELFLQNTFYWSWNDIIIYLKSCETFVVYADSYGLLQQLICALLIHLKLPSSSNTSPETVFSSTSESTNAWWFDDLIVLSPKIIEKIIKGLGAYRTHNNSLILAKFLLHYLKKSKGLGIITPSDYSDLADTAVDGVISASKCTLFSCRRLLWILRLVSDFGVRKHCRACLEKRIGEMLDRATLDDLMVSGHHEDRGVYDVNLVLRLITIFVNGDHMLNLQRMKKVGRLIDKYLGEISPDQNLKVSKFVGVAQSLPDIALMGSTEL